MNTIEDLFQDLKMGSILFGALLALGLLMLICFGGSVLVNVVWDAIKGVLTW